MKKLFLPLFCLAAIISCNSGEDKKADEKKTHVITGQTVNYSADTLNMVGYISYDSASEDKRPVVLVVHEWWGISEYTRSRARQLADMGYLAMAVDMYGNATTADNPELAGKLAVPFYTNPGMAKQRFDAALAKVKSLPQADTSRIAAIGYCFGGAQVLNMARMGTNLRGVVSFHGNLVGVPADKSLLKADVLGYLAVCQRRFDFIFAGPPYALTEIDLIPQLVIERNLLNEDGIFVLEHTPRNDYKKFAGYFRERNYGTTVFSFFQLPATP